MPSSVELVVVPPTHVDFAWRDGAAALGESCVEECTPDQLKTILGRGERTLVMLRDEGKAIGWGAFRVDPLPNMRVLHVTNLAAHHAHFELFFAALKDMAHRLGCSRVRCSCLPAQARLFKHKCGFTPVYETLEVTLL